MSKYAYVTFVMRNDSFIPGALCFAYALKKQGTKYDTVCIISDGVTDFGKKALEEVFTHVVPVEQIYVKHNARHERQDRPFLFTRFNAFLLGPYGGMGFKYEKIILADADLLPIENYDKLFELEAPAGIINEYKEHCVEYKEGKYIIPETVNTRGTWVWHDVYADMLHGEKIPSYITNRVTEDYENKGVLAALWLLKPSIKTFNEIMADTEDKNISSMVANFKWPEMQYLTYKFSGEWTNIDLKYASFNGYPNIDILYGTHYAGLKPWSIKNKSIKVFARFDDYKLWYETYLKMMNENPKLSEFRKLERLRVFIQDLVINPKNQFNSNLERYKHLIR